MAKTDYHKFQALKKVWKKETAHLSSVSDIIAHRAYKEIIAMGDKVIPWILSEMAKSPDHWFAALFILTGYDVSASSNKGHIKRMTSDWLRWGRERKYI